MFSANVWSAAQAGGQGFVFGFRVPRDYFISKGWGDTSDVRPCTAHSWVAFAVKALALHTLLHRVRCWQLLQSAPLSSSWLCTTVVTHSQPSLLLYWPECCALGLQLPPVQIMALGVDHLIVVKAVLLSGARGRGRAAASTPGRRAATTWLWKWPRSRTSTWCRTPRASRPRPTRSRWRTCGTCSTTAPCWRSSRRSCVPPCAWVP